MAFSAMLSTGLKFGGLPQGVGGGAQKRQLPEGSFPRDVHVQVLGWAVISPVVSPGSRQEERFKMLQVLATDLQTMLTALPTRK